ncbi:hypothetical protein GPECTOR_45g123 [Gonium pectorale]|uniref:Poly [ADP-ribose] polymerase n=1 Tax=Gonium pectorale TaxID=33097 RepID=A0A150G910_GONPE|nr:hypothetical protein GPECTOR_45g123 [Gonium pectorale]|eukprot:KXZ46253.1 hypothetical protein GPECTOR_45g123 [Gonium pectorale]
MSETSLQELLAELKAYPDGADLLLTAFYTAAHHYRRSTICTPFPTEVFPPAQDTKEKDFPALQAALASLPPVHSLLGGEDVLRSLTPQARGLLQWLLLNAARRRRFSLTHMGEMDPFPRGVIAYHGTHLENLHSIVHTGLQNLSGTRLQRTGAIFGDGIYLSTNYDTAFSFCQPCPSWPRSRYGTKLRVLLVCEVDLDRSSAERGADAAAAAGRSAAQPPPSSSGLPDTYLLVQRADAVRLLFVLVFCDATAGPAGGGRGGRVNWCTVLVVLYAAFLVGKALLAALRQHRY